MRSLVFLLMLLFSPLAYASNGSVVYVPSDTTPGATIAIGPLSLANQTSSGAYDNIGIGKNALKGGAMTTAAIQSVAIGTGALTATTTGFWNIGIGYHALLANTTGHANVGIGTEAEASMIDGIDNICIGYQCLKAATSAQFNVAMGIYAGTLLTTNGSNTLIGTMAGRYMDAQNNTYIGYQAGCGSGASCPQTTPATMTGGDNVGIGLQSFSNLTSGSQNTGLGTGTGGAYTTTSGISMMGYHAGVLCADTGGQVSLFGWAVEAGNTNCANDTAFGYFALGAANGGHDNTAFGNFAAAAVTSGSGNVAIGDGAMAQNVTTGVNNIVIGNWWPASNVSNTIGIGMVAPGSIQVTGDGTLATEAVTLRGSLTLTDIATDATHTDRTICQDSTSKTLFFGSGTLGICLGTSSIRYKHDVENLEMGLAEIDQLKPITFFYKKGYGDDGARKQIGFAAEDVVKVIPQLVGLDKDSNPNSVDLLGMVPIIVRGMQQQQNEIAALSPGAFPFHKCFFNLLVCPN